MFSWANLFKKKKEIVVAEIPKSWCSLKKKDRKKERKGLKAHEFFLYGFSNFCRFFQYETL